MILLLLAGTLSSPVGAHAQAYLTDGSSVTVGIGGPGDIYRTSDETPVTLSTTTGMTTMTDDFSVPRSASVRGQLIAQNYRSVVTSFAETLLTIADRENERVLAAELRDIADAQKVSEPIVTNAIQIIASRGALRAFFFGGSKESIVVLKDEMLTEKNILNKTEAVLSRMTDEADISVLADQLRAVRKDQTDIQNFITAHENTDGLFDWLKRF